MPPPRPDDSAPASHTPGRHGPEPGPDPKTPPSGVLYPNLYVWFIFLAAMDVFGTYLILNPATFPARLLAMSATAQGELIIWHQGAAGAELNPLADWLIQRGGVPAKVAYKFSLVLLVILVCEIVGRRRPAVGRRLAEWAVALTTIPVVVGLTQLAYHAWSLL